MDVRMFTVGPVQENCYLFRREGSDRALIVDPGDEADRLLPAIDELGVELDGILLTHTHFDHVGAVAPVVIQEILVNGLAPAESFVHAVPKLNCRLAQFPAQIDFHPAQEGRKIHQADIQVLQHAAGRELCDSRPRSTPTPACGSA